MNSEEGEKILYELTIYISQLDEIHLSHACARIEGRRIDETIRLMEDTKNVLLITSLLLGARTAAKTNAESLMRSIELIKKMEEHLKQKDSKEHPYFQQALFFIGYCHQNGIVLSQDIAKTRYYYGCAIAQGNCSPVNYYLHSLDGVLGKKLDWESRYQLNFFLRQLYHKKKVTQSKLQKFEKVIVFSKSIKTDSPAKNENILSNKIATDDLEETLNLIEEIIKEDETLFHREQILKKMNDVTKNLLEPILWVGQPHKYTSFLIGYCFHRGIVFSQDDKQAYKFIDLSANQGFEKAQYYLTRYSLQRYNGSSSIDGGIYSEQKFDIKQEVMRTISVPEAQLYWAQERLKNEKDPGDNAERLSISAIQWASNQGYAPAQYFLVKYYNAYTKYKYKDFGSPYRTDTKWIGWYFQLAADQGWMPAILEYASELWNRGYLFDPLKSLHYSQMAVQNGCSNTKIYLRDKIVYSDLHIPSEWLAAIYYQGFEYFGIPRNIRKAKTNMNNSYELGNYESYKMTREAAARFNYHNRLCYENGLLPLPYKDMTAMEIQYDFNSTNPDAQYNNALHFLNSILEGKTAEVEAFHKVKPEIIPNIFKKISNEKRGSFPVFFLESYADVNNADTFHNLAICYEQSIGVPKDLAEAERLRKVVCYLQYNGDRYKKQMQLVTNKMQINCEIPRRKKPGETAKVESLEDLMLTNFEAPSKNPILAKEDLIVSIPCPVQPETWGLTAYNEDHCAAFFLEKTCQFEALERLEESIRQGNQDSKVRRDALLPLRKLEKELQNTFEQLGKKGCTFLYKPLTRIVAGYVSIDMSTPKGPKLGLFGEKNK